MRLREERKLFGLVNSPDRPDLHSVLSVMLAAIMVYLSGNGYLCLPGMLLAFELRRLLTVRSICDSARQYANDRGEFLGEDKLREILHQAMQKTWLIQLLQNMLLILLLFVFLILLVVVFGSV